LPLSKIARLVFPLTYCPVSVMSARSAPARNDACHRIARTRIIGLGAGLAAPDRRGGGGGSRADLGRGILLGLELLVAADIIGTVAATPTLRSLAVLGLIVLIRTFLSFSLEVEIEGRLPWRAAEAEAARDRDAAPREQL